MNSKSLAVSSALFLTAVVLLASFGATSRVSSAPQTGRVTEAFLKADSATYEGPCPAMVHFSGYIKTDGPANVNYLFERSDGATMKPIVLSFTAAGVQRVDTTWTLGDTRSLPRYEGWEAIKTSTPNQIESNHATGAFKLVCGKPNGGPQGNQPPANQPLPAQARFTARAETVAPFLSQLAAEKKQKFDQELASLKSLSDRYAPALAAAQQKVGFNAEAMRADFRNAAQASDPGQRRQQMSRLQTKYQPQLTTLAQSAGINTAELRRRIVVTLNQPNMSAREEEMAVVQVESGPGTADPPPPPPPSSDTTEQILSAPYTDSGTVGGGTNEQRANAQTGWLSVDDIVQVEGSVQKLAFISQELPVAAGVRRVRVFAKLDPVHEDLFGICFLCYESAEAIVNLHVLEGSHEVCSDRVSLGRFTTAVIGAGTPASNMPVELQCEVARANPDDATTYSLVAELEAWAGGGGVYVSVGASAGAAVQQFHVYQHRN